MSREGAKRRGRAARLLAATFAATLAFGPVAAAHRATRGAGDLDPSFGDGGEVTTAVGFGSGSAMVLQADGKIVVAGTSGSDFALARYNTDGTLDPAFGNGGVVTTSFGTFADGAAVSVEADGKLVVAGAAGSDVALARYRPNGTLDHTFGTGGRVVTDLGGGDGANAVAIQADGKIVAAGASAGRFALVRYDPLGALDATFGHHGFVRTAFDNFTSTVLGVAIQADGKIVAAGDAGQAIGLARYGADGSLDATFGRGGRVMTAFAGYLNVGAEGVVVQPDGRIVVAGNAFSGSREDFALARYGPGGSLDSTFGSGGKVTTSFIGNDAFGRAVTIQRGGRIVVAGYISAETHSDYFGVTRYHPNGALDASFGAGGLVTTAFVTDAQAEAAAVQPDGKIVLGGGYTGGFALARYLGA